ncbi:UvrD-helicase domain-containing protein [Pajaroellobacter abortibovis]|uniref:DNA 3'-5' helicase II n=1 Tax=Pajaroellobacter abortibovis TaxID=1882918 RepID=A0A1L6MXA3_9BACT|nr:UvrD-helicase domain-containing protein [Pajaroellobacter abortibovis]APS00086.1 hypothetical protein BCY86_04875 [Pajaroellobacter abortibovis]
MSELKLSHSNYDKDGVRLEVVQEEEKLLQVVKESIQREQVRSRERGGRAEMDGKRLLELRDEIAMAKPEDLPMLFEQMHHLAALHIQRGRGVSGKINLSSPYFAHIRLEENGRKRDILIGACSYLNTQAGIRIVDWRNAPITKIYYCYKEGDEYEEQLGDRLVNGIVLARRSVSIVDGVLIRVSSEQGMWLRQEDGTWQRSQRKSSHLQSSRKERGAFCRSLVAETGMAFQKDKYLSELASQLDPEQFAIVSQLDPAFIAIQGVAGSGKTTVGLHRMAYLHYLNPERYRPERMMVIVHHSSLVRYTSRVLPSLGVVGVPILTFARLNSRLIASHFPKLALRLNGETPLLVARVKSHLVMLRTIHRKVEEISQKIETKIQETIMKWPKGAENARAAWKLSQQGVASLDERLSRFVQWLKGEREFDDNASLSLLHPITRGALENKVAELRPLVRRVSEVWEEILTDRTLLGHAFRESEFSQAQLDQVHEWCVRQSRIRAEGGREGETSSLDLQDHALLLRLWQMLRGPLLGKESKPIRLTHLFVDEVQDANPIALRVLIDLCDKRQCITLAGDAAQRMVAGEEEEGFDWSALLQELSFSLKTVKPLQVSYRCTAEVTSFSRQVLGPYAHEVEPTIVQPGPPVEVFGFDSAGETISFLADALKELFSHSPYAHIALIARFEAQADLYYEGLLRAEVPLLRRIKDFDFTWEPGVDVTDVSQTKGLEFDEVILLEVNQASYPDSYAARRALYIGATRTSYLLWCITVGVPSPLIPKEFFSPGAF